jgi:predicted enzyme related to lactoylglutathione lyase
VCFYTVYVDSRLRHNRARLFEIERGSIVTSMPLAAVRVFVRNLEQAIGFYKRNFDWPMTGGGASEGYCVFDVGDVNLVIEPVAADADEEDQAYVGRFTGISFRVDDIASAYASMLANGVVFTGAPEKQFWGGTLATLRDPAGNEVQIVQYA